MRSEPIVVVGAGPTGAMLGIELARQGADVRVIEKAPMPPAESRAGGIQSRTLELFARLGIVEELLSIGNRIKAINYYSGVRRIARVDFGYLDSPYPFMLHIPQYETQRVLDDCLGRLGVPVERGVELVGLNHDPHGVTLEAARAGGRRQQLSASYVVGCDGAHSVVRHQLNMPFDGQAYEWTWMGGDVRVDWAYPESEVHLFISRAGVLACLPFGGGRWRLITPKVDGRSTEQARPNLEELRSVVAERGPMAMRIDDPTWLGYFQASRRSAAHYRQGRVFLAGDAVHIHSPAAGQGMNTGLGDAANLGWKLGLVATGRAPTSLLDSYELERAPVAKGVIALTHRIMRVFDSTAPFRPLRDRLLPLPSRSRIVQRQVTRRFSQHWVSYRGGPLAPPATGSFSRAPRVRSGDRAPQVTGLLLGGKDASVFDLISRPEHTVFITDGSPDTGRYRSTSELAPYRETVKWFRIRDSRDGYAGPADVTDPDGRFVKRYGIRPGWVCAIRPDGHVGYIGEASRLRTYLSRCLIPETTQPARPSFAAAATSQSRG